MVNEDGGSDFATGSHSYSAVGVYTIGVTVTDKDQAADQSVFQYVVVYDPNAGFVTGGGWITSPAGAYVPDPELTGKANFGFVSKYKKGATTPDGQTEFQFKAGDLNFHSTSYEWLVIAGAKSQFKGVGQINDAGNYGFMLTAADGEYKPDDGFAVDTFRIKIWDKNNSDEVVYDNQLGVADDIYAGTVLGGGSIVVHDGGSNLVSTGTARDPVGMVLVEESLAPAVEQAIAYWAGTGVSEQAVALLRQVDVFPADLSGRVLGIASSSNIIWIDQDAAGFGWNLDGSGGMDLLSLLTHELGHKLGLNHGPGVMRPTLGVGEDLLAVRANDMAIALVGRARPELPRDSGNPRVSIARLDTTQTESVAVRDHLFESLAADYDEYLWNIGWYERELTTDLSQRSHKRWRERRDGEQWEQSGLSEELLQELMANMLE